MRKSSSPVMSRVGVFTFFTREITRALHVVVGVVPGIAGEPILRAEGGKVGGEDPAVPVDDGIETGGGAETVGAIDHPAGEHAAAGAAGDEEVVGVDVALGENGVDAGVEVVEIVAGIGVMNQIGEFFAVAGAAARVGVEDDVTLGGPDLRLQVETIAVVGERTAVNLEDEGIFLGGIKIRRLDDPAFDFAFVEGGFVPEFLDCAEFLGGEEFAIERGEDVEFGIGERSDGDVAGIGGRVVLDGERAVLGDAEIRRRG